MKHRNRKYSPLATAALLMSVLLGGAVLVKTDGTRLEGDVSRDGDNWVITAKGGTRTTVPASDVKSLDFGGKPDASADAGLASLRRSIETQSDPKRAIERYKQFVQTYKGTNAAAEAQLDLATWEDRLDRGMVKIGGKWITSEEAATLKAGATDQAKAAIEALRQSKMQDANDLLSAALTADPANATALYVRGVVSYRTDKLPDAKKAFEACLVTAPMYGPTLNNLAVTTYRMNQIPLALNFYDKALVAMPLERGLINNVAEALEALPEAQKNSAIAQRVRRKFEEQEAILAQRLAQQGLFRWGATWVTQKELDDLKAAEQKIKDQLDQLAGQYQALADQLIRTENQISANQRDLADMERRSLVYDNTGRVVQLPLPPQYATLKTQTDQLLADHQVAVAKQAAIRTQAKAVQKQLPTPKYTGIQQIFAAEAAPVPAPPTSPSATTHPG
jgi:tetratricopeptide (TPR) repeat protein